jgi:ABC-2 type transport system ATP-binding protein
MLSVRHVSKSYGKKVVVQDFNLEADYGEIIGLVGENGAGKSTLLKILTTLTSPSEGEIYLEGDDYKSSYKKIRGKIGYVPQELALWEDLTALENMRFFAKLSKRSKTTEDLKDILKDVELQQVDTKVRNLSGGMKRKLNLAISLIPSPKLLLLDEPTVGIDLRSRIEIGRFLKALVSKKDKTIVYISHDMDEIKELCDRVIVIGKDDFYKKILHE